MKIKIGFWNVLRKLPTMEGIVADLIRENNLDIMCFAETGASDFQIRNYAKGISKILGESWQLPSPRATSVQRTEVLTRMPTSYVTTKTVDQYFTSLALNGPNIKLLLLIVHFPSLLNRDRADVNISVRSQASKIRTEFESSKQEGFIVLGDFNLNPFDDALMAADGFNATNDRRIVERKQRTVDGTSYPYTYNPCWSLLGEAKDNVPGSYYMGSPGAGVQHWHTLDQVLFCSNSVKSYSEGSLKRVVTINNLNLLRKDRTGVVRVDESTSDHLPFTFEIYI